MIIIVFLHVRRRRYKVRAKQGEAFWNHSPTPLELHKHRLTDRLGSHTRSELSLAFLGLIPPLIISFLSIMILFILIKRTKKGDVKDVRGEEQNHKRAGGV